MGRAEGRIGLTTREIARAATAIESRRPEANELLRRLFPLTGRALVAGITGPPGAGKSTLVDQLIHHYRQLGKRVAVVAVDPSSPYSGGAIMGDRVRMTAHHADPDVFIRSMATRGWMGGLARATTDLALLFDAAGFDVVLVETVGVGQDEVDVARLAGVTVVLLVPGMGDDIQAIKSGILEIADVFAINKADQPGADRLERELQQFPHRAPIIRTVATTGQGIAELAAAIQSAHQPRQDVELWSARLREMLRERLLDRFDPNIFAAAARQVASRERDPYTIVEDWVKL